MEHRHIATFLFNVVAILLMIYVCVLTIMDPFIISRCGLISNHIKVSMRNTFLIYITIEKSYCSVETSWNHRFTRNHMSVSYICNTPTGCFHQLSNLTVGPSQSFSGSKAFTLAFPPFFWSLPQALFHLVISFRSFFCFFLS